MVDLIIDIRTKEMFNITPCKKYCYIYSNKKKRPIFMVLYISIQLGCCNKNKTKMLIKRPTHKNGIYLILSSDLEGLLNLMCTQLFPLSSGS